MKKLLSLITVLLFMVSVANAGTHLKLIHKDFKKFNAILNKSPLFKKLDLSKRIKMPNARLFNFSFAVNYSLFSGDTIFMTIYDETTSSQVYAGEFNSGFSVDIPSVEDVYDIEVDDELANNINIDLKSGSSIITTRSGSSFAVFSGISLGSGSATGITIY
jgi:hypothetical protein